MDRITNNDSMPNSSEPPLAGLDPAELLKQGAADDTLLEGSPSPFIPPSMEELGPLFPQFEFLDILGKGGMGAVYKVRQRALDRMVALKVLPPSIGETAGFSGRFTREAKALAKLNHTGIVTLYEFGQQDDLFFIVMEFVDGVNLRQLMQSGRISPREALAIVPQICDALQFAHDQGIVHRDIKPENILLDRLGRVKVADFGIAKLMGTEDAFSGGLPQGEPMVTEAGNVMGTPQYMAPEQMERPGDVDHRADIYALGVVFYQMLTGELPGAKIEMPSSKVRIDVRLDEMVLRALEKEPERRYQTASEFRTVVDGIHSQASISPSLKQGRGASRRWLLTVFGILMILALPGAMSYPFVFGTGERPVLTYSSSFSVPGQTPEDARVKLVEILSHHEGVSLAEDVHGNRWRTMIAGETPVVGRLLEEANSAIQRKFDEGKTSVISDTIVWLEKMTMSSAVMPVEMKPGFPLFWRRCLTVGGALSAIGLLYLLLRPGRSAISSRNTGAISVGLLLIGVLGSLLGLSMVPHVGKLALILFATLTWIPAVLVGSSRAAGRLGNGVAVAAWGCMVVMCLSIVSKEAPEPMSAGWRSIAIPLATSDNFPAPFEKDSEGDASLQREAVDSVEVLAADPTENVKPVAPMAGDSTDESDVLGEARKMADARAMLDVADRYLDAVTDIAAGRVSGLGNQHPSQVMSEKSLARLKENYPTLPDATCLRLAMGRIEALEEKKLQLKDSGLGEAHPSQRILQARIEVLQKMEATEDDVSSGDKTLDELAAEALGTGNAGMSPFSGNPMPSPKVTVELQEDGSILVDGVGMPLDQLGDELKKRAISFESVSITLKSAVGVEYAKLLSVIYYCQNAGIDDVTIGNEAEGMEPVSRSERWINMELEALRSRADYLESDPLRIDVEKRLAEFRELYPDLPDDQSRMIVAQRKLKLLDEIGKLSRRLGTGNPRIIDMNKMTEALDRLPLIGEQQKQKEAEEIMVHRELPAGNGIQIRMVVGEDIPGEMFDYQRLDSEGRAQTQSLRLSPTVIIWDQHVAEATFSMQDGDIYLNVTLGQVGAKRIADATKDPDGKMRLAILVKGRVVSAPVVMAQLGGKLQISGLKDRAEVQELLRGFPNWEDQIKSLDAYHWLLKIDSFDYDTSYKSLASLSRSLVSPDQWKATLDNFRKPLGVAASRVPTKVQELQQPLGMPPGEYRMVTFGVDFEHKKGAVETVSLMKEEDGNWKPTGYFVR